MFFAQEVVRGEPRVNPRRRFTAAPRNHSHLERTSNPSTGRKLGPNRRVQKNAGKRAVFGLGAGGRRFEPSRPTTLRRHPKTRPRFYSFGGRADAVDGGTCPFSRIYTTMLP